MGRATLAWHLHGITFPMVVDHLPRDLDDQRSLLEAWDASAEPGDVGREGCIEPGKGTANSRIAG